MKPPWSIEFFDDDGGCPVPDFLDGLDKPRRAKVVAVIALLAEQGLRTRYGKERYRLLYFGAPGRAFVLLHALKKSTEKLPARDIKVAEARMQKHLKRLEGD